MLQSNTANRANKAKSENVTVNGKQILVTMIARISRDQKLKPKAPLIKKLV